MEKAVPISEKETTQAAPLRTHKHLLYALMAGALALGFLFQPVVLAGTGGIVVVERICSSKSDGLNLAIANIHNVVSNTRKGIEAGESIEKNKTRILNLVDMAKAKGANMILFPEFSLTGYFWSDPDWKKEEKAERELMKGFRQAVRKRDPHRELFEAYNPKGYAPCWAYMNKGALDNHKEWLKQLKGKLDDTLQYVIFNALRRDPESPSQVAGPDNKLLNSTYVVDKNFNCDDLSENETARIYDKTFLPGIENVYEKSGRDDVLVIDTPWGRFGFTTCYDMCFSQLYETYGMKNRVDGVIELASWRGPAVRAYPMMNVRTDEYYGYQWNLMAAARAATNQIWMIACNSVGLQRNGNYVFWGSSGIWAPSGIPLFQASNSEQQLCMLHQVDIRYEVESETHAFDFYNSFKKIYRPILGMRAFTRMEPKPAVGEDKQ
ncbi:MAG: carbon-nitrogen hydrolase family protein [Deltaproteobacteria bacterium]|nr:carbon-nitrogen hydrolase family protein [Deltaproteobacteria bacterium]